jgi:branched-subunit amino acid transport protein
MSWAFVLALGAVAYGIKLFGAVIVGQRQMPIAVQRSLFLIPAALLAGLITKDTFTTGHDIVIDARAAGLTVAVLATWKKAPFWVIILGGVGTTALIRLFV